MKRCREFAEASLALATALNPITGYSSAAEISNEAYKTGKTVRQVVIEKGILKEEEAKRILNLLRLTRHSK